ncbi:MULTISPECIES: glycosyltransferase [Lactococcus]|uniref:glycosyltransferase n=1 Tax=Lactococcus TaxID=1357 RepID=UPI00203E521F|nr:MULTISPECIES: glycosyltransferase family 2 protein [Lactococcus]
MNLAEEFSHYAYPLTDNSWQSSLPTFTLTTSREISQEPKISVVIANYNNAPYLKKMLDSLVHQTLAAEHIQIMFLDDKSTDDSIKIVETYMEKYPSIELYVLDKNTGGAHGPRNVGIDNARGQYMVFLDADDWYDLDALAYMTDLLDRSSDDFAVTGMVQSVNGHLSMKSKPYYYEGEIFNRDINSLSPEFYGWLGPQAVIVRSALIHDNNLHFVHQRVADDVTFFYQAMRFSKTITQGERLTTYLNRDADNESLSKTINRDFMISWLRALGYIHRTYPDDLSKEKFISRRLEWLVWDFILRTDIGYTFGKKRFKDFKTQIDYYLGQIGFDPTQHFRTGARMVAWQYLKEGAFAKLMSFHRWHRISHLGVRKFKAFEFDGEQFAFKRFNKKHPLVKINVRAIAEKIEEDKFYFKCFTREKVEYVELRELKDPYYNRVRLEVKSLGESSYLVHLPKDFDNDNYRLLVITDLWHEHGFEGFSRMHKGKVREKNE